MSVLTRTLQVCGYVLSTSNYSLFAFACTKCGQVCEFWPELVRHIKKEHVDGSDIDELELDDEEKYDISQEDDIFSEEEELETKPDPDKELIDVTANSEFIFTKEWEEAKNESAPIDSTHSSPTHVKSEEENKEQNLNFFTKDDENSINFSDTPKDDHHFENDNEPEAESSSEDFSEESLSEPAKKKNKIKPRAKKKQIVYQHINFVEDDPLGTDFIRLLKENPVLWDNTRSDYNNLRERKTILENWQKYYQETHNISLSYHDLLQNLEELRRYYNSVARRRHYLSEADKWFRKQCKFIPPLRRRMKCEHCKQICWTQLTLQAHLALVHKIGENPYKCDECGKAFTTASQRDAHVKQVHTKQCDYVCNICDRQFVQSVHLDVHMRTHTGQKDYVCETCGKSFARLANMRDHEIRVHLQQRNFHCHLCPKSFYRKSLLKDHLNAHFDIRKYKCPFCTKGFHSAHSLMRHKQIHSEVKRYECKLCDAKFHQFVGLNAHMKNRHKFVRDEDGVGILETT